jgi:hypothetical protein
MRPPIIVIKPPRNPCSSKVRAMAINAALAQPQDLREPVT